MAALDLRLRRLERTRRDHDGVFFLAMGRDDAEIEAVVADARANLVLQANDLVVRLGWPGGDLPASRWILNAWSQPGVGETLSKAEKTALEEQIDQLRERRLRGEAPSRQRLAGTAVASSKFAASGPMERWSDLQLTASILGEPVTDGDGDRA